jgi:uncharacterized protein (DUF2141 family)
MIAVAVSLPYAAQAAKLEVVVAKVRNGKGHVRIAVCSDALFLKDSCQWNGDVKAAPGEVTLTLDVPPGTWAVQAFQDEDDSGEVTRSVLGFPTEGIGFSNDAPFRFGPPKFADAAFRLGAGGGRVRINLRYF